MELTLLTNPAARDRLKHAVVCDDWLGAGPLVFGKQVSQAGVIAIGDAGAFIDPFTGSGILLALTAGEMIASSIAATSSQGEFRSEIVEQSYRELFKAAVAGRFAVAGLLRRMAVSRAARRFIVPLLASHSGLTRLFARATREGLRRILVSGKE